MIRVFIVAASPWLREGLQNQLDSRDLEIVGSARSIELAREEWSDAEPDTLLIVPPDDTAAEWIAELNGIASQVPVAMLCEELSAELVGQALRGSVRAVLPASL